MLSLSLSRSPWPSIYFSSARFFFPDVGDTIYLIISVVAIHCYRLGIFSNRRIASSHLGFSIASIKMTYVGSEHMLAHFRFAWINNFICAASQLTEKKKKLRRVNWWNLKCVQIAHFYQLIAVWVKQAFNGIGVSEWVCLCVCTFPPWIIEQCKKASVCAHGAWARGHC